MKTLMHIAGIIVIVLSSSMIVGCIIGVRHDHHGHRRHGHGGKCPCLDKRYAIAVLYPTEGNQAHGTVTFTQVQGGVRISAELSGLTPNARHAIHIHQFGDTSNPHGKSAGGHYNPKGHPHAAPDAAKRHAGDLGNLEADADGHAHYYRVDSHISVAGWCSPIIGRSVVVHAGPDDLTSQPSGNAGARIAVGVIGLAQTAN